MNTWNCTRQGELYHHGIKGQKWGVRRFQNKDGSLTPAGKKRYDEPNVGRKTSESVTIDGQTFKVYGRNNKQYADKVAKKAKNMGATVSRESKTKEARESKTKEAKKYKIPENKSLHRLKLEEKYMKNGMTREEAEQAASKRIRTEKFVAGAAAVTVASAVAYAKYKGYTSDKVFKENTDFQRIMRLDANAEISNGRQYLAINKGDKVKYKGFLGDGLRTKAKSEYEWLEEFAPKEKHTMDKIYDVTVKNKDAIKIASRKKATDAFAELYKTDADFRKSFEDRVKKLTDDNLFGMGLLGFANGKLDKVGYKLKDGKQLTDLELKTKGYDLFNIMLTQKSSSDVDKFYSKLIEKGVNAVVDVNDKKYSGYKSKLPIITFDGDYEYIKRAMSDSEIDKNLKKAKVSVLAPELVITGASFIASHSLTKIATKANIDKKVLLYKQEHPNTKLSDAEIEKLVTKQE